MADESSPSPVQQNETAPPEPPDPAVPRLAPRQKQVLALLMQGNSEKQIAQALGLSPHTVHVYIRTVYRSFNVNSRGELLAVMLKSRKWAEQISGPATPTDEAVEPQDDAVAQICRMGADAVARQISVATLSPAKLRRCAIALRKLAEAAAAMKRLREG